LLFLDVDGVFNPFAAASCPPGYKEYALFPGEESVRLAIQHGDWVRELQQVFVVVWATGWGEHANNLLAPLLGLRRLPLVGFPPAPFPSEAKVPAVASYAGPHPAAWIDDCHTEMGRQWANDRGAPTMLLACDPATGWTRQTVDELLAWVDELDPARPAARRQDPAALLRANDLTGNVEMLLARARASGPLTPAPPSWAGDRCWLLPIAERALQRIRCGSDTLPACPQPLGAVSSRSRQIRAN
jgi:hypothetical protein